MIIALGLGKNFFILYDNVESYNILVQKIVNQEYILDYAQLNCIATYFPDIFEIYYKNNNFNPRFISNTLYNILKNSYIDQYLILEKYCPPDMFIEYLLDYTDMIRNIDILDLVLSKYSHFMVVEDYKLFLHYFNWSIDIFYRLAMYGKLNIFDNIIIGKNSFNFVKWVYYNCMDKNLDQQIDFLEGYFPIFLFDYADDDGILNYMNKKNILNIVYLNKYPLLKLKLLNMNLKMQ